MTDKMKENYGGKSLAELEAMLDAAKADLGKPSPKPPMDLAAAKRNSSANEEESKG